MLNSAAPSRIGAGALTAIVLLAGAAHADIFDSVKDAVGEIVDTTVQVHKAPAESVANSLQTITGNARPESILDPYRRAGQSAGNALTGATTLVADPQRELYRRAQEEAARIGGEEGEFVFDVATFTHRFHNELISSGAYTAANILRGQNPLQVHAAPLAAAIRAARERHISDSHPLPADVKSALSGAFQQDVLDRARYAVGTVEITLPNFIGQNAKYMSGDYAVVVDDVIVFNSTPPSFDESPFWWTHEVTHVEQYARWGVESFSYRYLQDGGRSVEGEADHRAASFTGSSQHAGASRHATAEYYVARCFFPQDQNPVAYLVSNQNRIWAVETMTGRAIHIGWATPPLEPNIAWTYETPRLRYAVTPQGHILTRNQFGQWLQIGHVENL